MSAIGIGTDSRCDLRHFDEWYAGLRQDAGRPRPPCHAQISRESSYTASIARPFQWYCR